MKNIKSFSGFNLLNENQDANIRIFLNGAVSLDHVAASLVRAELKEAYEKRMNQISQRLLEFGDEIRIVEKNGKLDIYDGNQLAKDARGNTLNGIEVKSFIERFR